MLKADNKIQQSRFLLVTNFRPSLLRPKLPRKRQASASLVASGFNRYCPNVTIVTPALLLRRVLCAQGSSHPSLSAAAAFEDKPEFHIRPTIRTVL